MEILRRILLLPPVILILLSPSCSDNGAWDELRSGYYPYRTALIFDQPSITESLENFPLLVTLNPERTQSYLGFQPDGSDIRFFDPGDRTNPLAHEIERWDTSGVSLIWVKVPELDASSGDDFIWMCHGNPAAPPPIPEDQVWAEYTLVYHFADAVEVLDSSPGTNHGRALKNLIGSVDYMAPLVSGRIGNGYPISSITETFIDTGYQPTDLFQWTVEAWIISDNAPIITGIASAVSGPLMGDRLFNIGWDHDNATFLGTIHCRTTTSGYVAASLEPLMANQWYYLAGVYDPAVPALHGYRNGVLIDTNTAVGSVLDTMLSSAHIGTSESRLHILDGTVDEVRISSAPHSSIWVNAQFLSMTDRLVKYGSQ